MEEFINKIIHGNCIEIMKQFPDKSIDLCLTDLPYGMNFGYDNYVDTKENLKELISLAMPEILRVSKAVLLTCGTDNIHLYPKPDWTLAWVYPTGSSHARWGFSCWQPILAYGKNPYMRDRMGCRPDIVLTKGIPQRGNYDHPCPKDVIDWERILLKGSNKITDIILDPFCGSGTTPSLAKKLGRRYIGIDLSKKYCEISQERVDKQRIYKAQKSLFEE